MADEKRIIDGYKEMYAIRLGGGEIILADNPAAEARYMVCDCSWNNPLGVDMYDNAMGGADFLEVMKLFADRISERVVKLEIERETHGVPLQTLTAATVTRQTKRT